MHVVSIYPLFKEKITKFLKDIGFLNISFYGGEKGFFYDNLFKHKFNESKSDTLNIIARRS